MTTVYYTHPVCQEHDPGPGHAESPLRLRAIAAALEDRRFDGLAREEAPLATYEQIARVHPMGYIERSLAAVPVEGYRGLDADTVLSPKSGEAALRSAGALVAAVDDVASGRFQSAFCAVRPPGHHAEPERSMGFCIFNNVAIGATHARARYGPARDDGGDPINRVAVVDFDVHHGNGTQAMFWSNPDLFFASTHQSPLYPGTGSPGETGIDGNILNLPLPPGAGSAEFRHAITRSVLPALRRFDPDLLMISAGFDAHMADPLAQLNLQTEDFAWVTRELKQIAADACDGRLVSTLEGGYDLDALAESVAAHIDVLLES